MIGLLLLLPVADVSANAVADRANVRLSDSVRVTLSVEGAAPLAVTVPDRWLAADSSANWRARPLGEATIDRLANGRERWKLTLRLDPYATGDPLPLSLNAATVRAGNDPTPRGVEWPAVSIRVTSDSMSVSGDDARPITGIELVPEVASDHSAIWWAASALAVVLVCVAIYRMRSRPFAPAESSDVWAKNRVAEMERMTDPKAIAAAIAETLRGFATRKYGLPLECRTTAEVAEMMKAAKGFPESVDRNQFAELLAECDRIQFDSDTSADIAALKSQALNWIQTV